MSAASPTVKGWCPGVHRPMMSGDGLVVRVRPRLARLTRRQVEGLCDLAGCHGNGFIDLTNRANLQIRGVSEAGHDAVLRGLATLHLLDSDPAMEGRRNILTAPFWTPGDLTARLTDALLVALPDLPDLPAKVGFAVDTGPQPLLGAASADFRFERGASGLILRADGCALGRPVTEATAIPALTELARWFDHHRTPARRRMAQVTATTALPAGWAVAAPLAQALAPAPGPHPLGALLGAAFGQIDAAALAKIMQTSGAVALRVTPWRLFLLEGAEMPAEGPFITTPGDPLLATDACPGAPFCPSASVETRNLARQLAERMGGNLHVSGCAKGCAGARPAARVFVGREGRFDIVENGLAGDTPHQTGITRDDIISGDY